MEMKVCVKKTTLVSENGPQLPICCQFDESLHVFRVTRSRGKTLAAGGFGVFISTDNIDNGSKQKIQLSNDGKVENIDLVQTEDSTVIDNVKDTESNDLEVLDDKDNDESENGSLASSKIAMNHAQHYLYIEEVIFLHERGLIDVYDVCSINVDEEALHYNGNNSKTTLANEIMKVHWRKLESYNLYNLLPICDLSLAAYRVYAHLRNQTYRVVRHTDKRRSILEDMKKEIATNKQRMVIHSMPDKNNIPSDATKPFNNERSLKNVTIKSLRLNLREDAASATAPTLFCYETIQNESSALPSILYDVYKPNSLFSRSSPGLPDYYVTGTFYNAEKVLTFNDILHLVNQADGIPLWIATVSDSGTVVMFGVTDFGVPEYKKDEISE
jgi:hypothetical protein